ncbi:hypothetical protein OHS33_11275 [Streptomyces sp. NBC_00536]|uniref:hypothetical protein n=1 Tax=Streptomyces sp. NBC_00536 TaxID=2975769 RepID=UPI002E80E2CF|nr:hypothetical protein [Streptomyces sp. NBC_00536]WUC78868.1 hypothetical protein OHS33_11275 [Streptomyces sp. NBC_00536]
MSHFPQLEQLILYVALLGIFMIVSWLCGFFRRTKVVVPKRHRDTWVSAGPLIGICGVGVVAVSIALLAIFY